jgi:glucokinase
VLRFAPNLPGAAGADFRALLRDPLGREPVVENDANLALLAELQLGAASNGAGVVMVTLGTGIGGGIAWGGRILTGSFGFAAEVGHMVVDPSGPLCPCGQRGCWERFASGGGLGRLAREAALAGRLQHAVAIAGGDPEDVRGEHVTTAALAGDPEAAAVMEELGWWVALGLANLTAVLDPALIVIGGGLAEAGGLLLEPTRRAFATLVEGRGARPDIDIVLAALGLKAGAVGAALAAWAGGLTTEGIERRIGEPR